VAPTRSLDELGQGAKISKDAKLFMQEAVSEFICFLTSQVNDNCQGENRRTMIGEDFLKALNDLGKEQQHARRRADPGRRQVKLQVDGGGGW